MNTLHLVTNLIFTTTVSEQYRLCILVSHLKRTGDVNNVTVSGWSVMEAEAV